MNNRLIKCIYNILLIDTTFFMSYMAVPLIIYIYYFVHESGHWIFGFIYNLPYGIIAKFSITSWVETPLFFLKVLVPQQTTIIVGSPSIFFTYGGMFFGIFVVSVASFLVFRKMKYGSILAFSTQMLFLTFEFVGNFLCGTDNNLAAPLIACQGTVLESVSQYILLALIFPVFFIFYVIVGYFMKRLISLPLVVK